MPILLETVRQRIKSLCNNNVSFANSLRTLKALTQSVSTQIGVGLAAALRHVIIFLRETMRYVLKLAQAFATFMQTLFGKYEGGAKGIAMDMGDVEDYATGLADSANSASKGLGNAADAAEKLKKDLSVLPFDELNQLNKDQEKTSALSGLGDTGTDVGGLGDLNDLGDALLDIEGLVEESTLPESISKWAERIREAFLDHDWKRLGFTIADMLNEGLEKLYDLLDPEKVMQKVEPFIEGFTTTFNSLVERLNFTLIGQTIARGINDVAAIFNSWYEKMGFEELGVQLSNGLDGLLTEGQFREWGMALGNKFMMGWEIFKGFVSNDQMWIDLGNAVSEGVKGLTAGIKLGDIGLALSDFINGLATALAEFASDEEMWSGIVDNLVDGINTFIENTEWKENGDKLNTFLQNLADALSDTIDGIHWEDLGKGLGETLTEIKFGEALRKLAFSIVKALAAFLKGFLSQPDGEIALAIVGGLTALNLGTKLMGVFGTPTIGAGITKGIATSLGMSVPAFGAVAAGGIVQSILVAKVWDDIPTTFGGKILPNLEKAVKVISSPETVWRQLLLDGAEKLTGIDIPDALESGMAFGFASPISTAAQLLGGIVQKVKEKQIPEGISGEVGRVSPLLEATANNTLATFGASWSAGYNSNVKTAIQSMAEGIKNRFDITEQEAAASGERTTWRYGYGFHNTAELSAGLSGIHAMVQSKVAQIQNEASIIGANTASGYGRAFSNQSELNSNLNRTQQTTNTAFTAIKSAAESIGNNTKKGVLHGLNTHLTGLEETTNKMMGQVEDTRKRITDTMTIDLSGAGSAAASSFANGFSSVHIPVPNLYVSGYDTWSFGDGGYTSIPRFALSWYKAGGLFSGGKGQVIGIGEDNRDEAVLPLENRRAMSRIADSIVNASSGTGLGISKNDIVEGVVQALLMTQNNQGDPIFHIEVKTENDEVLARAVTRGQKSIDYRNNPTPQLAY